ncbi:MAG: YhdP family protein [Pseudomonadota bacterium]
MSTDQPLTGWRRRLSQLKSIAWTAFAMCAIGLAVLVGLGSLLLPYADRWTPQVAEWLEQQLGQPVQIDSLSARWEGYGPHLNLAGITVGHGTERLRIDNAEVSVDTLAFLRPGAGLAHFRILVEEVVVTRDANGAWGLMGLPATGSDRPVPDLDLLQGMGLRAQNLRIRDEGAGWTLDLGELELDLRQTASATRLSGYLAPTGDERQGQGAGRLSFVVESASAGSRLYLDIDRLALAQWQQGLPVAGVIATSGALTGQLWGSFAGGSITDVEWRGNLEGLALRDALPALAAPVLPSPGPVMRSDEATAPDALAGNDDWPLDLRDASARFSRTDGGWVVQLIDGDLTTATGTWPSTGLSVAGSDQGLTFAADWLPVADLATLFSKLQPVPESLRQTLADASPNGKVSDLMLTFAPAVSEMDVVDATEQPSGPEIHGAFQVSDLSWQARGAAPGFSGLDFSASLAGQQLTIEPSPASEMTLSIPEVLRWPLEVSELDGPVTFRWGDSWRLTAESLAFRNESVQATLRMDVLGNTGLPFVDLKLVVSEGAVAEAKRFWPQNKFNEKLLGWLDRALLDGQVTGGSAMMFGDLDDWPFRGGEGRFEAVAMVEEGRLDFDPGWPVAENLAATLTFDTVGMAARAPSGQLQELAVTDVLFRLPRYREPRMELDARASGDGQQFLSFLAASPLYDTFSAYLEGLEVDGRARASAHVELPLKAGLAAKEVEGKFTLLDADVTNERWQVDFAQTSGDVRFTHQGLLAEELSTLWEGFESSLSLATGKFVSNADLAVEARLTGTAPASVFSVEIPQLAPLLERIPEACEWVANLAIQNDGEMTGDGAPPRLTVKSLLEGSEVQLPAPLSKPTGDALPMELGVDLPEFGNLALDIADLLKLRFRPPIEGQPWGGTLHLGPGDPAVNDNPGLLIEGRIDYIDLDEWQDLLAGFAGEGLPDDQQRWLTSMDLTIDQFRFAYRDFTNLTLRTSRDDDYWTLHMKGDQVEGTLRVPLDPDGRRLLLAELDRLEWPPSSQTLGPPSIDPARIPPLRFVAGSVSFDGVPYGSVSFESYPVRDGMHIDHLETQSDTMAISASGDWLQVDGSSLSQFGLTITGDELGAIFEAFGYGRLIEGGQTIVRLDVNWPGALSDFEMNSLNGDMDVNISNGQIVEVKPGAGRIFGLMSLQALPRRLTLDFSDLFKSGLTFDSIEGNFRLEGGSAFSENLTIEGPTADIEIKGRTDLASQGYDQVVTVIPEVGSTLPVVGALAGGAGGAAAAFLLQNLFDRQIDAISQFHYSVTGSFEEPVVELIGASDERLELETARALRRDAERQSG